MFVLVKTGVKFRNFQISKFVNTHTNRIFSSSFQVYVYIFEIYISLKNNSVVRRSSYFYKVNKKFSSKNVFFLHWRYFSETPKKKKKRKNPLLSKSTLKYLVCSSILGRSTESARPVHISMGVVVSLTHFKWPATQRNWNTNVMI